MRNNLLLRNEQDGQLSAVEIYAALQSIQEKLQKEIECKQHTIEKQEESINILLNTVSERDMAIKTLNKKFEECQRSTDGNRQLVNKLLNDINRMQQDVEWYKRTYERRSLLGLVKDKLKYLFS